MAGKGVSWIERSVSADQIGPTKSGRPRWLTVGTSTALLWRTLEADWRACAPVDQLGPWVFAADAAHRRRLTVNDANELGNDHLARPL